LATGGNVALAYAHVCGVSILINIKISSSWAASQGGAFAVKKNENETFAHVELFQSPY
jgi:hypothetical protein